MTPCTAPRCGDAARWTVADRQLCRRHMLDALLAGRIGQAHAVPLEAEALEVEPEPVARLTNEERAVIESTREVSRRSSVEQCANGASRVENDARGFGLRTLQMTEWPEECRCGNDAERCAPRPQPTLTDAEREAVAAATANYQRLCDEYGPSEEDEEILAALRGLLERTK